MRYSFGNINHSAESENLEATADDVTPWVLRSEDSLIYQGNAVIRTIRKKINEAKRSVGLASLLIFAVLASCLPAFSSLYRRESISEYVQQWFSTISFIHNKDGQKRHPVFDVR